MRKKNEKKTKKKMSNRLSKKFIDKKTLANQ